MSHLKTAIIFTHRSPFYLVNGQHVVDEKGNNIETSPVTALCRCGKSNDLPYCDNAHEQFDIDYEKSEERSKNKWRSYVGDKITIHFNLGICCHVGICLKDLPTVFNKDFKPWIDPNGASPDEIISQIKKCPSGALTYSINDQLFADFEDDETKIKIVTNGPLVIRGDVDLIDDRESLSELHAIKRYTLCRCGKSKNKPFCDGSHRPPEND